MITKRPDFDDVLQHTAGATTPCPPHGNTAALPAPHLTVGVETVASHEAR